jgi:dTDP-glucose pyrophosphorylase/CBS domain-containing protein
MRKQENRIQDVTIQGEASVAEALERMDRAGTGALVVCDEAGIMVGLLTDGDVRRAVLRGVSLAGSCGAIANKDPIVARGSISPEDALLLMMRHDINHLPVVDDHGGLRDFLLRRDLITEDALRLATQKRLESIMLAPSASITEAIAHLDAAGTGGIALCGPDRKLLGLLTDGDIRRAILKGASLDEPCMSLAVLHPVTARAPVSAAEALRLMVSRDINHLPVVNDAGQLVDFILRRDLISDSCLDIAAVIMAGGYGKRMLPLTAATPKPMLPVGDRPLLERTVRHLRRSGIREISLTTHYLSETIRRHFGDGEAFGVHIDYTEEDQPLGTAGALRLLKRPESPLLVLNGDVLTGVSFSDMLAYHRAHSAEMTVGVRKHELSVPFGVIDCEDARVTRLREKPVLTILINAGVYLIEPTAYDLIPNGERFDMTDLIEALLQAGRTVVSFPIIEYWQDVGRLEDYRQAQEDAQNRKI